MRRYYEALMIWAWLQWRLPPQLWFDAQKALTSQTPPNISTPALAQGLNTILDPKTTNEQRLLLLQQLLTIIKNGPQPEEPR